MLVLISYRKECLEEDIHSDVEFFSFASEDELCQCLATRLFEAKSDFKNIILRNWQDAVNIMGNGFDPQTSTSSIVVPWPHNAENIEDRDKSIDEARQLQYRIRTTVTGLLQIKRAEKESQDRIRQERIRQERITEGTLRLEIEKAKLRLNDFLAKKKKAENEAKAD